MNKNYKVFLIGMLVSVLALGLVFTGCGGGGGGGITVTTPKVGDLPAFPAGKTALTEDDVDDLQGAFGSSALYSNIYALVVSAIGEPDGSTSWNYNVNKEASGLSIKVTGNGSASYSGTTLSRKNNPATTIKVIADNGYLAGEVKLLKGSTIEQKQVRSDVYADGKSTYSLALGFAWGLTVEYGT